MGVDVFVLKPCVSHGTLFARFPLENTDIYKCTFKEELKNMADEDGGGPGNFVWAIALIIIVAIIAAVVMSGGFLSRGGDKNIDVEIKTPAR